MKNRTKELPTVEIHGKFYTVVPERIKHLANNYRYSVDTEAEFVEVLNSWKVKATVTITETDEKGNVSIEKYSAHGCEMIGSSDINHLSALENAETSAVGRACGFAGIGLTESIASAEEVQASKDSVAVVKTNRRASAAKDAEEKTLEKMMGNKKKDNEK